MVRAVVFVSIATLMATSAFGQSLGSHVRKSRDARSDIHESDPAAAEKAVNFVARCTAEMRSPVAKKILDLPYMERKQKKLAQSKVRGSGECVSRVGYSLKFSYPPLVGGMAEYYITDVFKDNLIELVSSPTPGQESVSPAPRNGGEIFSQCVARKDARAVKNFISAEPASFAEKQALQHVKPLLGQCIPAGEKIALDKISLRAMLSFGLYRELAALDSADVKPMAMKVGNQ